MKRIWQRFVGSILGAILLVGTAVCGTACTPSGRQPYEEGYFQYKILTYSDTEDQYAAIVGLTESGKEEEVLVLPETIGGLQVQSIGILYSFIGGRLGEWESQNLKKLFVPYGCFKHGIYFPMEINISFNNCPNLKKIVALTDCSISGSINIPFYYASDFEAERKNWANISYMYNYEESPNNGYYWIDDLDYGSKIDWQPQNPEREGYVFQGWYKESECLNEWNFDEDTLPEKKYTEDGGVLYQETRLYAKWA